MELFSLSAIVIYAAIFGITMKIADLLDEHGLKWFYGDKILFGLMWGFFGILLVWGRADVANILFARILVYIPRKSLDYMNHALAAVMIIVAFAWKASNEAIFNPSVFFIFFFVFLVFGSLRDYFGKKKDNKVWLWVNELALYHIFATLIYSIVVRDYSVFLIFTVMQMSYNIVKYGFYYAGWCKEL
jgi:hypothetical protein